MLFDGSMPSVDLVLTKIVFAIKDGVTNSG